MRVQETWISSYEFACYTKSCAPPPAGKGGSSPNTSKTSSASRLNVGAAWTDKEHGAIKVVSVARVSGKNYDKVVVEENGPEYDGQGKQHTLFLGSTGANKRVVEGTKMSEPYVRPARSYYSASKRTSNNSDDGYDAYKDGLLTDGVWGYGKNGKSYRSR